MADESQPRGEELETTRLMVLSRLMCGFSLVLLGVTHRLWWSGNPLPIVPWFAWGVTVPLWGIQLLTGVLVLSLIGGLLLSGSVWPLRWRLGAVSLSWGLCLLLDQNRLQPWAWEFWLIATIAALCPPRETVRVLRALIISIYVYSAVSKLDIVFLKGLGPLLWSGLLAPLGIDVTDWSTQGQMFAAALLPLGELLVAGLLLSQQRRWGLRLSIVQHLLLLVALGPLGLGHEWGVLLWNVFFIGQNVLLFGEQIRDAAPSLLSRKSRAVLLIVVMYPALEWCGLCDPWPAWGVYCHRPIRVWPLIHVDDVDRLPPSLQSCVAPPAPFSDWSSLSLDAWSFQEVHAPLYPEGRYRAALFLAVAQEAGIDAGHVGLDVQFPSTRWTGEREKTRLLGREAIEVWAQERWANTQAVSR